MVSKRRMKTHLGVNAALRAFLILILVAGSAPADGARQNSSVVQGAKEPPGATSDSATLVAGIREAARPLTGSPRDYDPLMELIGDARFVLLGEATHGTHEFYRERARITRRLIEEKGFDAVVLEADWPDAYRVNRYVRGVGEDESAEEALSAFKRFPRWMWRNRDVRDLAQWLRTYNDGRPADADRVGIYGMDLYSLPASADAVVKYLKQVDAEAARA